MHKIFRNKKGSGLELTGNEILDSIINLTILALILIGIYLLVKYAGGISIPGMG